MTSQKCLEILLIAISTPLLAAFVMNLVTGDRFQNYPRLINECLARLQFAFASFYLTIWTLNENNWSPAVLELMVLTSLTLAALSVATIKHMEKMLISAVIMQHGFERRMYRILVLNASLVALSVLLIAGVIFLPFMLASR